MLKVLTQPFPGYLETSKRSIIKYTSYAGLCVFIVLVLLKPFGLAKLPTGTLLLHAIYFGIVTVSVASLNSVVVPRSFRSVFIEECWTVGKELVMMLWNLLTITVINLFLVNLLYKSGLGFSRILEMAAITFSIGIFPVGVSVLLKQQLLLKKYYLSAKEITASLPIRVDERNNYLDIPNQSITITGENQGDILSIPLGSLICIEAFQNYVKIHFEENSRIHVRIIRSTLKVVEESLKSYPHLYRCQRAYIVNLSKVEHISGNAQGYKLHFKGMDSSIPVSRNNSNEIARKVSSFR